MRLVQYQIPLFTPSHERLLRTVISEPRDVVEHGLGRPGTLLACLNREACRRSGAGCMLSKGDFDRAKTVADIESSTTGHERAQEDLKNLLDRGGSTTNIGDGSTEPGDPAGTRSDRAEPGEKATGGDLKATKDSKDQKPDAGPRRPCCP